MTRKEILAHVKRLQDAKYRLGMEVREFDITEHCERLTAAWALRLMDVAHQTNHCGCDECYAAGLELRLLADSLVADLGPAGGMV